MPDLLEVYIADDLGETETRLDTVSNHQFRLAENDAGFGEFILPVADSTNIEGRLALWYVGGVHRFTSRIEKAEEVVVATGDEAAQAVKFSGRGLLSEWEGATVRPETGFPLTVAGLRAGTKPYASTRPFGPASIYVDHSGWDDTEFYFAGDDFDVPPYALQGQPADFPDPNIDWYWSAAKPTGMAEEDNETDPMVSIFRWELTSGAGHHRFCWAVDNRARWFMDNVSIDEFVGASAIDWNNMHEVDLDLTAGDHILTCIAENVEGGANTAGVRFGLWAHAGLAGLGTLVVSSNSAGKALHDVSELPGFTWGEIARRLLEEIQADGELTGWSLSCDDVEDSAGTAWPVVLDSVKVGEDGLTMLETAADAHLDFEADHATRTLHLWVKDTRGTVTAVEYTPGVDVNQLARDEDLAVKNVAIVEYADGRIELPSLEERESATSAETYGTNEVFVTMEDVEHLETLFAYFEGWFSTFAWPRIATTFGIEPERATDLPFVDFAVGDTVTVDELADRVIGIACSANPNGYVLYEFEVGKRAEIREEQLQRWLKAKANGAAAGNILAAAPSTPGVKGASQRSAPSERVETWSVSVPIYVHESGFPPMNYAVRYAGVEFTSKGDGIGDSVLKVYVDGVEAGSVTMGATDALVRDMFVVDATRGHEVTFACTQAGGHNGVVGKLRYYIP